MYRRILVILLPVLGDVLLGTPLLRALRKRYPDATIDVLVRSGCGTVLEGNADISGVIEAERRPRIGDYFRLFARLFRRYDLTISNALSDRATVYALAASRERVTWVRPTGRGFGWKRRVYQRWAAEEHGPCHPFAMNKLLAELLGLPYDGQVVLPRCADAESRLAELLGESARSAPIAILHPGSRMPYKHWRIDGWQELARTLRAQGYEIIVTGGPDATERQYIESIFGSSGTAVIAAGRLRLGDLSALFSRASLYIGVDTVVTHMAAGHGLPTVAVVGPEDPQIWAPWPRTGIADENPGYPPQGDCRSGNVALVHSQLPCVPCRRKGCENRDESYSRCLDEISAERVLRATTSLLDQNTAEPQAR